MYLNKGVWYSVILEGGLRFIAKYDPSGGDLESVLANPSGWVQFWHRGGCELVPADDKGNMTRIVSWDWEKWGVDEPTSIKADRIIGFCALKDPMQKSLNEQASKVFKDKSGLSVVQGGLESKV